MRRKKDIKKEPNYMAEGAPNPKHAKADVVTRALVLAFVEGDHAAFDAIYLSYFEPIRGFFNIILRNESLAEELCQDLFVRLWETRHTIDPDLNFRSYLYTMARSSALKSLRHKKVVDKYLSFALWSGTDDEGDSADRDLNARETEFVVRLVLAGMPEQRRRVFEMSRIDGISNDEIARSLGITESTVRAHLHNATKKLRWLAPILTFYSLIT